MWFNILIAVQGKLNLYVIAEKGYMKILQKGEQDDLCFFSLPTAKCLY